MPAYRVYVVQNPARRFYIGLSDDVPNRVAQHNIGVSQWTKSRGPWVLCWQSQSVSLSEARKLENLLNLETAIEVDHETHETHEK